MASTTVTNQPHAQDQPPNQPSETDQSGATGHQPAAGGTHPAATMSYTNPQQGYPVPPNYQGNPPQGYHPYYADQSAGAAYYTTTTYSQSDQAASTCLRCFCIIMFLLLIFALIGSIIFFRSEKAVFEVESFSISNFNVVPTNKVISGKWHVSIFVKNRSSHRRMNVDRWEASLYHKERYLTSGSTLDSISLGSKSKGTIGLTMETYNMTASEAAEDIAKEQKEGGNVSFGLRLTMLYTMKSGWFFHEYRTGLLRVKCEDLKVGLPVGANAGSMHGGKDCDTDDD